MALGLRDELRIMLHPQPGIHLDITGCGADEVPADEDHLIVRAVRRGFAHRGIEQAPGMTLSGHNLIPHGRGLGSSAAAVVAGLAAGIALADRVAGNQAAALAVQPAELLNLATQFEGHPDNAAAAIYGGLTIAWCSLDQPHAIALTAHPELAGLLLVPKKRLATSAARQALPHSVPHADAALTAGRAALLAIALTREPALLFPATEERLHQQQRAGAMPESLSLLHAMRDKGLAAVVSGAGPSLLVLCRRAQLAATTEQVRGLRAAETLAVQEWVLSAPKIGEPGVLLGE
jgi:homoserine kinase